MGRAEPAVAMDKGDIDPLPLTATQNPEGASCGDTSIELVAMARGTSHGPDVTSTDGNLTDGMDLGGDGLADDTGTIL
jgi:hypothetical protein